MFQVYGGERFGFDLRLRQNLLLREETTRKDTRNRVAVET